MQLITAGMGFVGLHTARAFLDSGEACVLTTTQQQTLREQPDFIKNEIGKRIFIERINLSDLSAVLDLQKRQAITGIVHLSGVGPSTVGLCESMRRNMVILLNILEAAQDWKVRRVSIASTIGVYAGANVGSTAFREDIPLPMNSFHPIPDAKKISELLAASVGRAAGFEIVNFRFGAWGPLFHHPPSPMNLFIQLVRAAVKGETVDFTKPQSRAFADDGVDLCYVKDCARGIALLQLTSKLSHSTYNIGCGRATTNRDFAEALKQVIPGATIELPSGFDPNGPGRVFDLDITRIREDTGYQPQYDLVRGIGDYVAWLHAGHEA